MRCSARRDARRDAAPIALRARCMVLTRRRDRCCAGKKGYKARAAMHKFIARLLQAVDKVLGPEAAMPHAGLIFSKSVRHLK